MTNTRVQRIQIPDEKLMFQTAMMLFTGAYYG